MVSMYDVANRDEVKEHVFHLIHPSTKKKIDIPGSYFPNRITPEPTVVPEDMEDTAAARNAIAFCEFMNDLSLEGPVFNSRGEQVVGPGERVPLEPEVIMMLPTWLTNAITDQIVNLEFPNSKSGSDSRRRS